MSTPTTTPTLAPASALPTTSSATARQLLRGGFGIFYDRLLDGIWEQNAFGDPPFAQRTTVVNAPFDNITSGSTSVPLGPNGLTATGNPTFKVPNYANYNLSVQHQLLPSTVLEVAYVGNEARHLLGEYDENQPTVGARLGVNSNASLGPNTSVNYIRPFTGYAGIVSRAPFFSNNYNSLQVSLNHHSHGLQVGLAYTYSKDLTTNSSDRSNMATDSYDFSLDYGLSSYNQPQTFTANYVYDLPFFKGQHGFEGKVLGGWQVSGITSFFSGQSFSLCAAARPLGSERPERRPWHRFAASGSDRSGAEDQDRWRMVLHIFVCPGHQPLRQRKQWKPARPRLQRLGFGGHQEHHFPGAVQFPTSRRVLQRLQPRKLLRRRQLSRRQQLRPGDFWPFAASHSARSEV